jgi:hypothetical protein
MELSLAETLDLLLHRLRLEHPGGNWIKVIESSLIERLRNESNGAPSPAELKEIARLLGVTKAALKKAMATGPAVG